MGAQKNGGFNGILWRLQHSHGHLRISRNFLNDAFYWEDYYGGVMDHVAAPLPYQITRPTKDRVPLVVSSPHSGRTYSDAFLASSRLDYATLRKSEDGYVDELFASAPEFGAPLISTSIPRAFVDLNREPYELDPEMFEDRLPEYANTHSARVAAGLGTIARVVSSGNEIYRTRLFASEALDRINSFYKPYHSALRKLISETLDEFGFCVLLDCHSMPSSGLLPAIGTHNKPPDFVLGDRHGTTCAPEIISWVEHSLCGFGYEVARNTPYAGGFTTEHYGQPHLGIHALQIEINRSLYMDENTMHRSSGMAALRLDLDRFLQELATRAITGPRHNLRQRLSAE